MLASEHFRITYCGSALDNGEMEVRELAPALHAIGDLLENANRTLNGTNVNIAINIKGSFKTGSFAIDFAIVQGLLDQAVELFSKKEVIAGAVFLAYLGIGKDFAKGLIAIIKWLKNRPIIKIETKDNKATIYVDGDQFEVEIAVLKLLQDYKTRKALEDVISKPLSKDGVDTFSSGSDDKIGIVINKEESRWFITPELPDEQTEDTHYDTTVQVSRIEWSEENKWRFTDGETSFYATIEDSDFLHSIKNNETLFAKDDILKVRVHKKQWITLTGVKSEYNIEKVIEHRSAARQYHLPLGKQESTNEKENGIDLMSNKRKLNIFKKSD